MSDRRNRILHLTFDMGIGGTEQVITQLVNNLDTSLYKSSIACIEGEVGLLGRALQDKGIEFLVFSREPGFDLKLIIQIRAALQHHQFDIIHCHQYTPFVYGVLAALFSKTKVVFTEHGRFHPDSYSWKRRLVNPLLGCSAKAIVAISKATAKALAHYEWFPSKSIEVVYNGIQVSGAVQHGDGQRKALQIGAEELVFGTIARFDSIKNLPMMIKSFRSVSTTYPGARLLLVGDGDERHYLEALVEEYNLQDKVIFTGYQHNTLPYMSVIDIYLMTSFSEGTSMTLLEALSMGICSIVTGVGGNIEIVEHEVSGVVVESADVAGLADWMLKLAADPAKRQLLGEGGKRVFAGRFSVDKMIEKYSDIYQRI